MSNRALALYAEGLRTVAAETQLKEISVVRRRCTLTFRIALALCPSLRLRSLSLHTLCVFPDSRCGDPALEVRQNR